MRIPILILAACVITLVPACSRRRSHHERVQLRWNAKVKEMSDLLTSVTDVPSARSAEPRLAAAVKEFDRVAEELDKIDPEDTDASDRNRLAEAVAQSIVETQRMNAETLRISKNPEMVAALNATWKKLPSVFMLEAAGAIPKSK